MGTGKRVVRACTRAGVLQARPAAVVATRLRRKILALYSAFLSADGSAVDYRGIAASPLFVEYVDATVELQVGAAARVSGAAELSTRVPHRRV